MPLPFTGSATTAPDPAQAQAGEAAAREQRVTELAIELQFLEARRDRQVQLVFDDAAHAAAARPAAASRPTTAQAAQPFPTTWPAQRMQQLAELEEEIAGLRRELGMLLAH